LFLACHLREKRSFFRCWTNMLKSLEDTNNMKNLMELKNYDSNSIYSGSNFGWPSLNVAAEAGNLVNFLEGLTNAEDDCL
jgi:hypothetical protein